MAAARPTLPARRRSRARARLAALSVLAALIVAACSQPDAAGSGRAGDAVVLHNCDREVVIGAPPQRAVSLNQGTTELLLALRLQDRMAGTATWTEPVRADLAVRNEQVPRLSDGTPSLEGVLDLEPDFVIGLYHAIFTDARVASRDRFAELGVPTYLSPASCQPEEAPLSEPVELGHIYGEIADVARIFGVPERGERLIAELRDRVSAAQEKVAALDLPADTTVLFWFGQTGAPYVAGSTGSPAIMARTLGVRNAYDDVESMWPQVSWEDVLKRDPTLLVLGDLTREGEGQTLDDKIKLLTADPAVSQLTAVRRRGWIPMRGTELNITISTIDGIEKLADALVEHAKPA